MKNLFILILCLQITAYLTNGQDKIPDYTSKVSKFDFANTLSEQENQLRTNPLMIRFAESRQRQSADRYRPIYHFVSPESGMNDPDGICFWQGNWHLFYQGYPPEDRRQHWGHAVSKDLIHWKDLPYAIYPNPERAVYSGSTLVEEDRVIAMYHGTMVGNMVAVSSDPLLLNWEKVSGAVIPIGSSQVVSEISEIKDFMAKSEISDKDKKFLNDLIEANEGIIMRLKKSETGFPLPYNVFDPCIWKKDSAYYSLSAGRLNEGPGGKPVRANFLFRSLDLTKWEYMHEFVEDDRFTLVGDDGACPYFWPIGDRYILPFFSHMSGGQYLLGDYDKKKDKFIVTQGGKFNFGAVSPSGVHAPSATPDGKGGVIIIFNMNPGKRTVGWNQLMTLPRRLTLHNKDELGIEPAGDIESLRYNPKHVDAMKLPANKEIVLKGINGNAIEIVAEIDLLNSQMVELNVLRSPNKEEFTRIVLYKNKGFNKGRESIPGTPSENVNYSLLSIDSGYSSFLPDVRTRAPETVA